MIIPLYTKPPSSYSAGDLYMEIGQHNYPFQIQLPFNLPTSFKHNYGNISYMLTATIDIPWSLDKHANRPFTVISNYDLNNYPALRMPMRLNEAKSMSSLFKHKEPLNVELSIAKGGFVCGERLPFSATIDNKSDKEICSRVLVLSQTMKFHATNKSVQFERNVASLVSYNGRVAAHGVDTWSDASIIIPPMCPSSNPAFCRIIEVVYELKFLYRHSGFLSNNFTTALPFVIGTIPFREDINHNNNYNNNNNNNNNNIDAPPPYTFESNYFAKEDTAAQAADYSSEFKPNAEVFNANNPNDSQTFYPFYANFGAYNNNNNNNNYNSNNQNTIDKK
jgi:hypothetical protein